MLTRRDFLTQAAKVFAGGAVLASGIAAIVPRAAGLRTMRPLSTKEYLVAGRAMMEGVAEGIKRAGDRFKPMKFYCPNCWRGDGNGDTNRKGFMAHFMLGWGFGTVLCPDCNTQWGILRAGETARIIKDPPSCDYGCENAGCYGFVPECGCPTHDPSG